jgi:hypothetical protein
MGAFSELFMLTPTTEAREVHRGSAVDEELDHTRSLVAFHESGHAIACDRLGIPYSEIHVSVGRTYWTGQLRYKGYVHTNITERPEGRKAMNYATMCLAGKEAEALYLMEQGWRKRKAHDFAEAHAGRDIHDAQDLVGRHGMGEAERKARRLVEAYLGSIYKLAGQL